jgi:redox-sensing transcriptional repressor
VKEQKKKHQPVPEPTVRRMPAYLHYLKSLQQEGKPNVSAPQIAGDLKQDPTQVVKDLAFTSVTGRPRIGYNVAELTAALEDFLGFNRKNEAFLIGVGNLGTALLSYPRFSEYGMKIIAAFDVNPRKVGKVINDVHVLPLSKLHDLTDRLHITFGIICTPASHAQATADLLVKWGMTAIWNFAPINIKVPDHVVVQNTSIYENLAVLLNKVKAKEPDSE